MVLMIRWTNPTTPLASGVSDELNIFSVTIEDARQTTSLFTLNEAPSTVTNRIQAHFPDNGGNAVFDVGGASSPNRVSGSMGIAVGENNYRWAL